MKFRIVAKPVIVLTIFLTGVVLQVYSLNPDWTTPIPDRSSFPFILGSLLVISGSVSLGYWMGTLKKK
jgi:hypothetical protein